MAQEANEGGGNTNVPMALEFGHRAHSSQGLAAYTKSSRNRAKFSQFQPSLGGMAMLLDVGMYRHVRPCHHVRNGAQAFRRSSPSGQRRSPSVQDLQAF